MDRAYLFSCSGDPDFTDLDKGSAGSRRLESICDLILL
ncbi:MAG: hypothetical protein BWX88_04218 [Planctomycetes bacterium ADurb.Bin126]|nr:MAG: hypothetical protein BWX88_04218 [Planctomycetes bacterium ADurb.Bin126]